MNNGTRESPPENLVTQFSALARAGNYSHFDYDHYDHNNFFAIYAYKLNTIPFTAISQVRDPEQLPALTHGVRDCTASRNLPCAPSLASVPPLWRHSSLWKCC